jgi:hypothetical protein
MCGLGVCVAAVLAHNYARFGGVLEFGQNYQLSGVYEAKMRHFAFSYVPHNAAIYFAHPVSWSREFPFVAASAVRGGPTGYLGAWNEAVGGLALTFPILWLALAVPLTWRERSPDEAGRLRTLVTSAALYVFTMTAVMLGYFLATPRYLVDFAPMLALLAAFGWLGVERLAQTRKWNFCFAPVVVAAGVATVVVGILLSFDYHDRLLQRLQPEWWKRIERRLTIVLPPAAN